MVNRKRVQDLVTINDALKAYYAKNGLFPKADGLAGANERGANWIPGLTPDYLKELPLDPAHGPTTQYVYASNGPNYKLVVAGASLVGSPNVEVLGIKIDPTRNPTQQSAAFGFWTPDFASV
jgi:Type II secretion system (T2SS), protein G